MGGYPNLLGKKGYVVVVVVVAWEATPHTKVAEGTPDLHAPATNGDLIRPACTSI